MKRSSKRLRRLLPLLALPASVLPASASTQDGDNTFIIATPGGATPDGLDTIHGSDIFALAERGLVYRAKSVTSGIDTLYSVRRTGTHEILKQGTVIPGFGTIEWMLGQIATNNDGEAVVIVGIRNGSGVLKEALVAGTSPSDLRVVAMAGQPIPGGGGQFSSFSPASINDAGQVGFRDTSGVYRSERNGSMVKVIGSYQQAPGEPQNLTGLVNSTVKGQGQVFFSGAVFDAYHGTGYNQAQYRYEPTGSITRLYRSRQAAPGTSHLFGGSSSVSSHDSGRYTVYSTLINAANAPTGWGIFTGMDEASLSAVAVTGQTAPAGAGTYTSFSNSSSVNGAGKVAYVGYCSGGNATSALFTWQGGTQSLVCKAGQAAFGAGNTFSGFEFPVIKDSGTILFAASLNGNETLQGIYLTDGIDIIKVAQAGDTVGGQTIQSLGVDPKAFNGFNQVAYQATLSGGPNGGSLLLFAPRLKWRGQFGGDWEEAFNWTASLVPSDYNDVDIIPADPVDIFGPLADTTVGSLNIGNGGEGLTNFKLRSGVLTAVAGVKVVEGGQLSGAGSIVGDVLNSSVVSPGNSPGRIRVAGSYSQGVGGSLKVEVAGAAAGQYDVLEIEGGVTLSGTLDVELLGNAIESLRAGVEIPFLTATGQISGQFANLPAGSRVQVADGLASFAVSYREHSVVLGDFQLLDSDSDGTPDYWMVEHFGSVNGSTAGADSDGDGRTNLDEFVAGTDPKNAAERFAAEVAGVDAGNVAIRFESVAGRSYSIEFSETLGAGSWQTVRSGIEGDGNEKTIALERVANTSRGYYRVVVAR